jgi:hypothetical protein|tara:strand:- start:371 stop:511 length:141 start_codon:yes stop_codon:yes gene_type:complete
MSGLKEKIETLANKAAEADKPSEAIALAQAALNLAQAYGVLNSAEE